MHISSLPVQRSSRWQHVFVVPRHLNADTQCFQQFRAGIVKAVSICVCLCGSEAADGRARLKRLLAGSPPSAKCYSGLYGGPLAPLLPCSCCADSPRPSRCALCHHILTILIYMWQETLSYAFVLPGSWSAMAAALAPGRSP